MERADDERPDPLSSEVGVGEGVGVLGVVEEVVSTIVGGPWRVEDELMKVAAGSSSVFVFVFVRDGGTPGPLRHLGMLSESRKH